MPPQLLLSELYSMGKKKKKMRTQCFDKVVELCHRRIRTVASYGGLNAFYEVPGVLLGYPLFDVGECTRYLVEALRKSGFLVQLVGTEAGGPATGALYVSWDPKELRGPPRGALPPPAIGSATAGVERLARALPRPVRLF
jgi:hypothetical protein